MAYTVTIEPVAIERGAAGSGLATRAAAETVQLRRLRRVAAYGPRCPDCTGPLVFGEGCQLCPVCGYSGCGAVA